MALLNGLGGVYFFSKLRMCQYPMLFCYISRSPKTYFGACRHSLRNTGHSCNQAYALEAVLHTLQNREGRNGEVKG